MNDSLTAKTSRHSWSWRVGGGLLAVLLALGLAFLWQSLSRPPSLPVFGAVTEFSLTNQLGQRVTLADLRGQVWAANVIFTRCPGPCPQMSQQLERVQQALPARAPVKLISLTSDPEFDTPAILKTYGQRFHADPARWMFLTGPKDDIRRLVIEGLKLVLVDKKPEDRTVPEDLFIHSTLFVVVDKHGRLRYSVESLEPPAQRQTVAAIRALLKEP